MKKLLSVLGTGFLCLGITACTSTPSPVAPPESTPAPSSIGAGKSAAAEAARPGNATIVQIVLQDDDEFDVLQAAVTAAGLVDVLNGTRQFTVFAPTDAAFVATLGVADEALPVEVLTDNAVLIP